MACGINDKPQIKTDIKEYGSIWRFGLGLASDVVDERVV